MLCQVLNTNSYILCIPNVLRLMHAIATLHSPHSNTSKHKEHLPVEKKFDYYQLNIEHISTLFTSISVNTFFHFTNKSDACTDWSVQPRILIRVLAVR